MHETSSMKFWKKSPGFTLIELLIVIAIIGLLAVFTVIQLTSSIKKAKIAKGLQFSESVFRNLGDSAAGIWEMDDGTGTTVQDRSGFNRNGTINGTVYWTADTASGKGGSLVFDGSTTYVDLGAGNVYLPLPEMAVCAWIKTPGLASGMATNGIFSMTYGLILTMNNLGHFVTAVDNGTAMVYATVPENLYDNTFHHLCLALDATRRYVYVDGSLRMTQAIAWSGNTRWPTASTAIGHDRNSISNSKFNGIIDDVRLFTRSVTSAQVQQLYAEGLRSHPSLAADF